MNVILPPTPQAADAPLYAMAARFYWIGHNLDQPGYGDKADKAYATLLELTPAAEKAAVQDDYGRFLASSGQGERAEPLLRAAYASGHQATALPLGMLLLSLGKQEESLSLMREYVQAFPQDEQAQKLLEAIASGNVEIKTTQVQP